MATVAIVQAIPVAARGPAQPKAILRAEGGLEVVLPYAPRGTQLGGFADTWDTLDRPGRKPLVQRRGDGLLTCSLTITLARPDHQTSVEDLIAGLGAAAASRARVSLLNMSTLERGPWRISGLSVAGELRQAGTNAITRATVTLDLLEASDPNPQVGPVSGGTATGGAGGSASGPRKVPKTYVVKKGDTLRSIAQKFYGDPTMWPYIAKANGIKDPKAPLKVGRTLKLPPDVIFTPGGGGSSAGGATFTAGGTPTFTLGG